MQIEMLTTVHYKGKKYEVGRVLNVPEDLDRKTAERWTKKRKPFAQWLNDEEKDQVKSTPEAGHELDDESGVFVPKGHPDVIDMSEFSDEHLQTIAREIGISEPESVGRTDLVRELLKNQDEILPAIKRLAEAERKTEELDNPSPSIDLDQVEYRELQQMAKERGIPANQGRQELLEAIQAYDQAI